MTPIAKDDHAAACSAGWCAVFEQVRSAAAQRGAHLAATVVLVPYAQLMGEARRQWQRAYPQGFAPRFETTRNWAAQLGAPLAEGSEYAGDMARDAVTARALLDRAGLAAHREVLSGPLLEMAAQLAVVAAAVAPERRPDWGEAARALLPAAGDGGALRLEAAAARIALEWVLASRHVGDVLFESGVRAAVPLLVVVQGFQPDPLARTLAQHWAEAGLVVDLPQVMDGGKAGVPTLHAVPDAEDEAQRAAACVLQHLAQGQAPVALVANDRALTRRISALLGGAGVAVHDENGWLLSTTHAAARLMAVLQACAWDATADAVLDWLKQSPAVDGAALRALEHWLRRAGARHWSGAATQLQALAERRPAEAALADQVQAWRAQLRAARPLAQWLQSLRVLLQDCGLWDGLQQDEAGVRVLAELRLPEGLQDDLQDMDGAGARMALADFTRWVGEVLECARYRPAYVDDAPVVVLPLPQLLARPFAALVLPGCDEKRLQAAPEPPGPWTQAQREGLGLPTRDVLAAAQHAAWRHALRIARVDLLWRVGDEGGEPLLPSPLVQALRLDGTGTDGADPRVTRSVPAAPTARPLPVGAQLPVQRLSSSAYSDLRHCPYRFFALRQLQLQEDDELDAGLDKRDFGTWLHAVLQHFHEALQDAPTGDAAARTALMDEAAARATRELGLQEGDFLPYASGWPALRAGYLEWLGKHEAAGACFRQAELRARQPLGALELVGTLDRVDAVRPQGGGEPLALVIDYKTESDALTRGRIKAGSEDTQLAFYAALLQDDTLRAVYVNVGERGETRLHEQDDVVHLRDLLLDGITHDMQRIAAGAPLPALGEGSVCEWCAARGLCRKDFWNE
ncbi:PD-(D/E)XK nuclease family protein [Diaphorobacter sp. C33]|uniref:ATP-dependent helicase/nuclease subunit B n=1 Tax=Diaphorobacter nitroreducens TaxID=164759 RepID=A0AAX1WSN5_9BURK|nr:PD-(D/E)XK nuclease family protein [Diaphorobacter sp. C33]ROR41432.1 ATP-dependent helicase/nuclease subunit B [Diaphorobacter nitroreducens]WKK90294.1 PD-(D/E)XK nuclease family protein [Diaphorobacter sp. C33]